MGLDAKIGFDTKGIFGRIGWPDAIKWFWRILELAIGAVLSWHVWATHANSMNAAKVSAEMAVEQQKQNMRLDRIERAITACLDRELDCEAQRAERFVK